MSFSDQTVVRRRCCRRRRWRNLFTFHLLLHNDWVNFNQTHKRTKHPWVKGIQVCSNEKPINSPKINNVFFSSLNQRYDIIICVY